MPGAAMQDPPGCGGRLQRLQSAGLILYTTSDATAALSCVVRKKTKGLEAQTNSCQFIFKACPSWRRHRERLVTSAA